MEQRTANKEITLDNICKRVTDTSKNRERISLNDFGMQYSQNFIVAKKKEKRLWKNLFLQKHMMGLMEE